MKNMLPGAAVAAAFAIACSAAPLRLLAAPAPVVLPASTGLEWHQTAAQVQQTCDDQIAHTKTVIAKIEELSAP